MKRAVANCYWCSKEFKYFQFTKPRRYCSGNCEYLRERHLQNERRRAKRAAARSGTTVQDCCTRTGGELGY